MVKEGISIRPRGHRRQPKRPSITPRPFGPSDSLTGLNRRQRRLATLCGALPMALSHAQSRALPPHALLRGHDVPTTAIPKTSSLRRREAALASPNRKTGIFTLGDSFLYRAPGASLPGAGRRDLPGPVAWKRKRRQSPGPGTPVLIANRTLARAQDMAPGEWKSCRDPACGFARARSGSRKDRDPWRSSQRRRSDAPPSRREWHPDADSTDDCCLSRGFAFWTTSISSGEQITRREKTI